MPPTDVAISQPVLSKIEHVYFWEPGHTRMMAPKSAPLTREEFSSLLTVGNTCAVREPPAVILAEHSARLIALGYWWTYTAGCG